MTVSAFATTTTAQAMSVLYLLQPVVDSIHRALSDAVAFDLHPLILVIGRHRPLHFALPRPKQTQILCCLFPHILFLESLMSLAYDPGKFRLARLQRQLDNWSKLFITLAHSCEFRILLRDLLPCFKASWNAVIPWESCLLYQHLYS